VTVSGGLEVCTGGFSGPPAEEDATEMVVGSTALVSMTFLPVLACVFLATEPSVTLYAYGLSLLNVQTGVHTFVHLLGEVDMLLLSITAR
jgi:hypothetical protein